uniref:Uncharacterized protein n=1 Tax=Ditylenchus dipsaci TaxID=166011 RepID=A0A915CVJ0_9BILA
MNGANDVEMKEALMVESIPAWIGHLRLLTYYAMLRSKKRASFSRPAVDYMLNELDLTELIRREENRALAMMNKRGEYTQHITRMSLWYDENKCGSKHMRHSICVFGIEDLTLWLAHLPHLFANKLLPEFDFGAIDCWQSANGSLPVSTSQINTFDCKTGSTIE